MDDAQSLYLAWAGALGFFWETLKKNPMHLPMLHCTLKTGSSMGQVGHLDVLG